RDVADKFWLADRARKASGAILLRIALLFRIDRHKLPHARPAAGRAALLDQPASLVLNAIRLPQNERYLLRFSRRRNLLLDSLCARCAMIRDRASQTSRPARRADHRAQFHQRRVEIADALLRQNLFRAVPQ